MDTTLADPLVGKLLEGRYRIDARIARGGMATVYRALDKRLDRVVAVKVMHPGLAEDTQFLARFTAEAKAAARLSSGHVVSVFDQGSHDGLAFLVMELVPGRNLRDLLHERGRLSPAQAVSVLGPVLVALAAAHRAGLVHRDVKPENVLLGDDGSVKVADFGLARAVEAATHTSTAGVLIGTAAYVAPEQVARGAADERTDVYAAGVLLFEMLTGSVPYTGESAVSVAYRHVHEDVPPPSTRVAVPPALDALVVRATRRDPGARPVDAGAFLAELRDVRDDLGLHTVALPAGARTGAPASATVAVPLQGPAQHVPVDDWPPRSRRMPIAVVAIILLGALMAGTGWWLGTGRYTVAPLLVGLTSAQAQATAVKSGLRTAVGSRAYSEIVPTGSVISQSPASSHRIRKGGTITLVLSRGKERHAVPDVRGEERRAAEAKLRAAKLTPQVTTRHDDTVPTGQVISQSLRAGQLVRPATTVILTVSTGPPPVIVPNLIGDDVGDAEAQLVTLGFEVQIKRTYNETVPKDAVISQNPSRGEAAPGSIVTLTVSDGPPLVDVPDVVGMKIPAARRVLKHAGFDVQVFPILFGDRVQSQTPGGGEQAPKGSTVRLVG